MDRIEKYKKLVREILEKIGQKREVSRFTMRNQYLFDDEHGQYMIHKYGWKGNKRIYGIVVHFEIAKNGKIWLHHDGTGLEIVNVLVERGVPKDDIVLAFHPEYVREDTGFAVA